MIFIRQRRILVLGTVMQLLAVPMMAGPPLRLLKKVGEFIDSAAVTGVDRRYIDAPAKPWQIIVRGNVYQSDLNIKVEERYEYSNFSVEPRLKTEPAKYVGLWAGYRGYGFGYTVNVGGDKGSYFTIGATGGAYGINVRIHNFKNDEPDFKIGSEYMGEKESLLHEKIRLGDPIDVHTVIADGYYLFNGRRFSYAAAYDQSVIQKRSAGSFMAGAMYYYGRNDYATQRNADMVYLMKGIGKVKFWQGSLGVGYAYNWVPVKGLLVSAMAMPMFTLVNKLKVSYYDTNVVEVLENYEDYGNLDDEVLYNEYTITAREGKTYNGGLSVNLDARLSVTYNFGRYFFNAYGQYNNFHYHHDDHHGYLNDWYVNASLGVRL